MFVQIISRAAGLTTIFGMYQLFGGLAAQQPANGLF